MTDPFRIQGPAVVSFSGGRTSAFMLHQILQAHGGQLPDDVVVAFANTGKEREETLRFVHECAVRWDVAVRWVEWREGAPGFEEVGYNSAAREGEPFNALIRFRQKLPNAMMRFCSRDLKVEAIKSLCRSLGWDYWANVIGLRHDEGHRVLKKYAENDGNTHRWKSVMPLDKARIAKADVMAFWAAQPFDLQLMPHEGNCDLCFLKSQGALKAIMRERPSLAGWWVLQEATGMRFERRRTYAQLAGEVRRQPHLPLFDSDEHDAECGLWCAADEGEAA